MKRELLMLFFCHAIDPLLTASQLTVLTSGMYKMQLVNLIASFSVRLGHVFSDLEPIKLCPLMKQNASPLQNPLVCQMSVDVKSALTICFVSWMITNGICQVNF